MRPFSPFQEDTVAQEPESRVLVVGESLVDVVDTGASRSTHAGGSPLNVAFGLARLGLGTDLLTEFGEDPFGEVISEHLREAGVRVLRQRGRHQPTSVAEATIQGDGSAQYRFDVTWTLADLVEPPKAAFIHTGSIAAVLEPGAGTVRQLFQQPPPRTILSYDPNIRPALMGSPETFIDRIEALTACAHIVKFSDEDAALLYPGWDVQDVCDRILGMGVGLFAMTLGDKGCLIASGQERVTLPALPVDVVDTIGAGDSFMSALLFAIIQGGLETSVLTGTFDPHALKNIATVCLTSAALTVSRSGAMPPTLPELQIALRLNAASRTTTLFS